MTNANETVTDIIAEMRALSNPISDGIIAINGRGIADRLEAAWKHEKSAIEADALVVGGVVEASRTTAEKSSTVGDAAKLREALVAMNSLFAKGVICTSYANTPEEMEQIEELYHKTKAALAEPVRNCDVGTAEEQFEMWQAFCNQYDKDCTGCPCRSPHTTAYCFAKWGQMPYKEGGAK